MGGYGDSQTGDVETSRLDGVPTRDNPIPTRLEFGTISDVHRAGSYYTFSQAFSGTPTVVLTGQDIGSASPELGTSPSPGSFEAQVLTAGSHVVHYQAQGPR